jgi:type II secretory pathway component GspD/PulD (secretin)
VWRELQAGVSLTVTPNVLRNMTSAELKIDLKTGDPQAGTREQGVRPLSRVSQHDVNTSVYVNALDFFDLSAFASQSTLNGGRGYVPIIGPVWQGLFGEIPIAGRLFSWKKDPQTVYSESLVLTNSFITPTAMGIALLYPTELTNERDEVITYTDVIFETQQEAVRKYKMRIHSR